MSEAAHFQLIAAVKAGDADAAKAAFLQDTPFQVTEALSEASFDAARRGDVPMLAWLVESDALPRYDRSYAFFLAAKNGRTEAARLLLKNGAVIMWEQDGSLVEACKNGHAETVAFLLEKGADIEAHDARCYIEAAKNRHAEVMRVLAAHPRGVQKAFDVCAETGFIEMMEELLQNGADMHAFKDFCVRSAAAHGQDAVVQYLIDRGADIHLQNDLALCLAAESDHLTTVRLLLAHGASPNAVPGKTLLELNRKNLEISAVLVGAAATTANAVLDTYRDDFKEHAARIAALPFADRRAALFVIPEKTSLKTPPTATNLLRILTAAGVLAPVILKDAGDPLFPKEAKALYTDIRNALPEYRAEIDAIDLTFVHAVLKPGAFTTVERKRAAALSPPSR